MGCSSTVLDFHLQGRSETAFSSPPWDPTPQEPTDASDDEVKHWLREGQGFSDGFGCHFCASWITGLAVVACMQPFDFAATRLVNQKGEGQKYTGPLDCIVKTVKTEGPLAVYKGVVPNYLRCL